jgi:hypothetical protein
MKHFVLTILISFFALPLINAQDIKLNGIISAENNQIKNTSDPTDAQDVATKNYVDGNINSFSGSYNDLTDTPTIYTQAQVNALILNLQTQISPSFGALGLGFYTELTGFTENINGYFNVVGSLDENSYNQKSYLMFSDNPAWGENTKVFMAEYNYDLNAKSSINESFSSGSGAVKNETTSIGSHVKYAKFSASGSNYNVNININSREEPLFLVVETFGSNNQFNFIFSDTTDEELISYWKNLLGSGNSESGLSNSTALSKEPTKIQAYLDDILDSGSPNRVILFSGDMINEILRNCSGTSTENFNPNYPEPEFLAKRLGGYQTYISFLSDGYENNIAKFMNCNTSYKYLPY